MIKISKKDFLEGIKHEKVIKFKDFKTEKNKVKKSKRVPIDEKEFKRIMGL